jgi:hypothetical protein
MKFGSFNTKSLLVPWSELRLGDRSVRTRPSEVPAVDLPETEEASEAPAVAL